MLRFWISLFFLAVPLVASALEFSGDSLRTETKCFSVKRTRRFYFDFIARDRKYNALYVHAIDCDTRRTRLTVHPALGSGSQSGAFRLPQGKYFFRVIASGSWRIWR